MKDQIETIIDQAINDMFVELAYEFDLHSGDIEPIEDLKIENIKEQLLPILERFVEQNK